jgi:F0F1-type ATP synthase beta subunit
MQTNKDKKEILKKHYSLDEICEILGFYDGSNEDVNTDELNDLFSNAQFTNEPSDWDKFEDKILDQAIINGNFEESIEQNCRIGL